MSFACLKFRYIIWPNVTCKGPAGETIPFKVVRKAKELSNWLQRFKHHFALEIPNSPIFVVETLISESIPIESKIVVFLEWMIATRWTRNPNRNGRYGREGHPRVAEDATVSNSGEEISTPEGVTSKTRWHLSRG